MSKRIADRSRDSLRQRIIELYVQSTWSETLIVYYLSPANEWTGQKVQLNLVRNISKIFRRIQGRLEHIPTFCPICLQNHPSEHNAIRTFLPHLWERSNFTDRIGNPSESFRE